MRLAPLLLLLTLLPLGCGSYVVLNVQDPQLLAADAVMLAVGQDPGSMEPIALEGRGFPLSVTVTATLGGERAFWVDALSKDGVVLGRALIEAELSGRNLPVVVELAVPCEGADFSGGDDAVDERCDDGVYCDGNERCVSRTCRAGPIPCPPSPFACADVLCLEPQRQCGVNVFHDRCGDDLLCDPGAGCKEGARCDDDASCQDDFACNGQERCASGKCQRGDSPTSEDDNACTAGACTEEIGVVQVPANEGGACPLAGDTAGVCQRGVCAEADTRIRCGRDADCDDGLSCNGSELCVDGSCFTGIPLLLDDGNSCTADACAEASGVTHAELPDGSACALPLAPGGVGRCVDGLCGFPHLFPVPCEEGCLEPADACEGSVAVRYGGDGVCDDSTGTCDFAAVEERVDCAVSGESCRAGACVRACCASGDVVTLSLSPHGTMWRGEEETFSFEAPRIELAAHNFCPGDHVRLTALGTWLDNAHELDQVQDRATALFSGSSTLLPASETSRIPDAIDVGADFITPTTMVGGHATDIAEDFLIDGSDITIPAGATHLFAAVPDAFHTDNGATAEGMAARLTCLAPCSAGCAQPSDRCDGDVAIQFSGAGTCDDVSSSCDYQAVTQRVDCAARGEVCVAGACVPPPCCVPGRALEVPLPENGTYLRHESEDSIVEPVPVVLAEHGICVDDALRLSVFGSFEYDSSAPGQTSRNTGGVFSSSEVLLSGDNLNRVAGAVEAGEDIVTSPTLSGSFPTDIAEDFGIDGGELRVPAGASHLFLGANDTRFSDNVPSGEGYGVQLECTRGLRYAIYEGAFTALPDFAALTPVEVGVIDGFDISGRALQGNDGFAYLFEGTLQIDATGSHTFFLHSDDGARLLIDGAVVVDNDFVHGAQNEATGSVELTAGRHDIRVEYFEDTGVYEVLHLEWQGPGFDRALIPGDLLFVD